MSSSLSCPGHDRQSRWFQQASLGAVLEKFQNCLFSLNRQHVLNLILMESTSGSTGPSASDTKSDAGTAQRMFSHFNIKQPVSTAAHVSPESFYYIRYSSMIKAEKSKCRSAGLWGHVEDRTKLCRVWCHGNRGRLSEIMSALGSVLGLVTNAFCLWLSGSFHSFDAERLSDRWKAVQEGSHPIPKSVQWI